MNRLEKFVLDTFFSDSVAVEPIPQYSNHLLDDLERTVDDVDRTITAVLDRAFDPLVSPQKRSPQKQGSPPRTVSRTPLRASPAIASVAAATVGAIITEAERKTVAGVGAEVASVNAVVMHAPEAVEKAGAPQIGLTELHEPPTPVPEKVDNRTRLKRILTKAGEFTPARNQIVNEITREWITLSLSCVRSTTSGFFIIGSKHVIAPSNMQLPEVLRTRVNEQTKIIVTPLVVMMESLLDTKTLLQFKLCLTDASNPSNKDKALGCVHYDPSESFHCHLEYPNETPPESADSSITMTFNDHEKPFFLYIENKSTPILYIVKPAAVREANENTIIADIDSWLASQSKELKAIEL